MAPAATKNHNLGKLGIPANGSVEAMSDSSKVQSPSDSDNAEKNLAALETRMNGKLSISTAPTPIAPQEQPDFSSDPLSATALTSPLHSINWDQVRAGSINSIANTGFSSQGASSNNLWEAFKRTGPRYPPSLEKLLMDYHHKHSKSWQLAHDMGAGSGVYSPTLARYFRHVHVSDPTPAGLTNSRMALTAWSAENKKSRGRFTFSTSKAEQGFEAVADRTVDMAIMMEGAHFTSPDSMVRSAGQMLSKDGTLALVTYSPICRINGNPAANDAVQRLFNAWGVQPWDIVCGEARGKRNFSTGLDFVALPDDIFDTTKTRRITINTTGKGSTAFQVPGTTVDASDSRVHNGERKHDYSSENNDEQARGWRQEVGPEFFRSMTAALVGQGSVSKFEEHFKVIEKIVHETSPNGLMITVEWTVAVLLATRSHLNEHRDVDLPVSGYNFLYDDVQSLPCGQLEEANFHAAIASQIRGKPVLDPGCGSGHYTLRLLAWGASSVLGMDASAGMIAEARRRAAHSSDVEFAVGDVSKGLDLSDKGDPFDVVVGTWLLDYASNQDEMVAMWECIAADLKPNGVFYVLTIPPALGSREELNRAYREDWAPYGTDGYVTEEVEGGFAVHTALGLPGSEKKVEFDNFYLRNEVFEASCTEGGMAGVLGWLPLVLPSDLKENYPLGYWNRLVLNPHFRICRALR